MKSLLLRITLAALIAATGTSTVYPLELWQRAVCVGIGALQIAAACTGIKASWNYHMADSDMNTVTRVNLVVSALEDEISKKPAFCKLEGTERKEARKIYVELHGEDKASKEENDYAKCCTMLVSQKAQAPIGLRARAMLKARPVMVLALGLFGMGSYIIKDVVTR